MTSLVIVESPAKCSKIQGFLGSGWRVIATMGHIRSLEESLDAIGLEHDFETRYQFLSSKSKAINQIKDAAKSAGTIYLASDDDREGEAISYSVAVLLGLNVSTTPRAVFHEITADAVKRAVANPRRIDMNRVDAQQARSVLDMMVGFTISPLLWNHIAPKLSAGRCQTPALRILVDREKEIQDFKGQTTWKIRGNWTGGSSHDFVFPGVLKDELDDQESALNFLENIHKNTAASVIQAVTKQWTESPPKPLITSTLQQEASALFGCAPKRTMTIAQRLYEAGHITYMRTDHPILSEEAKVAAREVVVKMAGDKFLGAEESQTNKKKKKDDNPQAQEAHEAIRPTHFEMATLPDDEAWDNQEHSVYKLIWNRAVQSVMASTKGDERVITYVAADDPGEFPWESKWRRTTFLGWRKIGTAAAQLDESEAATETDIATSVWIQAISIQEGHTIHWKQLEAAPSIPRPAVRYNEATLVRELEKKGIGRPSTYASLVGTLLEKKYANKENKPAKQITLSQFVLSSAGTWPPKEEKFTKAIGAEKDKMVPTPLGFSILEFCVREFPNLFDYGFTSQMETRLDKVAQGEEAWKQVCRDTWNTYKDKYGVMIAVKGKGAENEAKSRTFSDGLKAIQSKKGPLLLREDPSGDAKKTVFYGWPERKGFQELTEEEAIAFIAAKQASSAAAQTPVGSYNGKPIFEKKGPYGKYAECNGVKIPITDEDTLESIQQKLEAKSSSVLHTIGAFEFRRGQYGVYMFKKASGGKKPTFVGLPEGLDPKTLTPEAAEQIYKTGLENAKARTQGGRGGRGGFRGRGGAAAGTGAGRGGANVAAAGGTRGGSTTGRGRGRGGKK